MPILGAHESIAGGLHQAVLKARACGGDCVQLFTKNNNQWRATAIEPGQVEQFRNALAECCVGHPLVHDSYLINLASPDPDLWQKSVAAFADELRRAAMLGIPYVVTHPGSYTTSTLRGGVRRIVRALNRIHKESPAITAECLLETTAGQGNSIGWQFEHLAMILDGLKEPERVGVCFDTCHVFAAGYSFATEEQYESMKAQFDGLIGLARIKAFHLNDSSRELGSRVDRHAHIGRGKMGPAPFRNLLGDAIFRDVPMYLETPKGMEDGQDLDAINLRTLRGLIAPEATKGGRRVARKSRDKPVG
jgi:deoxyribonuclease IV